MMRPGQRPEQTRRAEPWSSQPWIGAHELHSVRACVIGVGLTALMLGLVFPPVGLKPLAYVALVPVAVLAQRSARPGRLAWTAWLGFAMWWGFVGAWMIPVTLAGHLALSIWMGLAIAAGVVCLRSVQRAFDWPLYITLPLIWSAVEVLRAYQPFGGMNWFMLAHSQASYLPEHGPSRVLQLADLFGQQTVGLYVAFFNGLWAELLCRPSRAERPGRVKWMTARARMGLFAGGVLASGGVLYGQMRLNEFKPENSDGPVIGLVQTNVPQDNKLSRTPDTDRDMWRQLVQGTETLRGMDPAPDWIVWPETSVPWPINPEAVASARYDAEDWQRNGPAYLANPENAAAFEETASEWGVASGDVPAEFARWYTERAGYRDAVRELAQEAGTPLLIGSSTFVPETDASFNSVYAALPDGTIAGDRYDKVYLVPFGETIPVFDLDPGLKDWFISNLTPYGHDYTTDPGRFYTRFTLAYGLGQEARVGTPICFEDTVARLCRRLAYGDQGKAIDVFVNLTNDGWFPDKRQGYQQLQIASIRCVETRVPMARAVNTGVSGWIDSNGAVLALVGQNGEHRFVEAAWAHTLPVDPRQTLYGRLGEWPILLLSFATAGLIAVSFVVNRRRLRADSNRGEPEPTGEPSSDEPRPSEQTERNPG